MQATFASCSCGDEVEDKHDHHFTSILVRESLKGMVEPFHQTVLNLKRAITHNYVNEFTIVYIVKP